MSHGAWLYDGSLDSLLVLLAAAVEEGCLPDRVLGLPSESNPAGDGLFDPPLLRDFASPRGEAVDAAADRLLSLSRRLYAAILRAWMSEEDLGRDLVEVALDCVARGEGALGDYSRPALSRLAQAVRRVGKEVHQLEGFARFSPRSDGRWVAVLEPRHNVLPALAPYFLGRFGSEPFALVDLSRRYAIATRKTGARLSLEAVSGDSLAGLMPDADEGEDAELWRRYFRIIENEGRRNPALQRRLMPARYWSRLTELGADSR